MAKVSFFFSLVIWIGAMPVYSDTTTKDLESFQMVWDTINEKHWDLKGLGVDWQEVYNTYKPKADQAQSRAEIRRLISDMLAELGQSHFQILENEAFEDLDVLNSQLATGKGEPGFKVDLIGDRLFIVSIDADSDAARQGLKIGTEILELKGKKVDDLVEKVKKAYATAAHAEFYINRTMGTYIKGPIDAALPLKVRTQDDIRDLKLALAKPKGTYKELFNFPPFLYSYESEILDNRIGYISFNVFLMEVKTSFDKDIKRFMETTDGLIIDLRDNPGGLGMLASSLSNRLVSEKGQKLGQMINSGGTLFFAIFPQKPIYEKPVAVLINQGSASTSEIFAAGLQDLNRARIFGTTSAGAALPSVITTLPNGDRFQYAIADYISTKGRHLEGHGVAPDEVTGHTLESLKRQEDAAFEAAIDWIKNQNLVSGAKHENL